MLRKTRLNRGKKEIKQEHLKTVNELIDINSFNIEWK